MLCSCSGGFCPRGENCGLKSLQSRNTLLTLTRPKHSAAAPDRAPCPLACLRAWERFHGAGEDVLPCRDTQVQTCTHRWPQSQARWGVHPLGTHTGTRAQTSRTPGRESGSSHGFRDTHKAKRHYGRHSLGFVLLIVSTGLNVSGQFYLHIAE